MNRTILVAGAIFLLGMLLVTGVASMYTADAKSKKSTIKVYVKDIHKIGANRENLSVCMSDDDGCFGNIKTVDLVKASNGGKTSKILAVTFSLKGFPNPDPSAEFGIGDVSACGKLEGRPASDIGCTYSDLVKVKSKQYKATLDYDELLDHLFND